MDSIRALNRYGLGARPGEAGRISDPRGWLTQQLQGGALELGGEDELASISERSGAFTEFRTALETFRIDSDRTPVERAGRAIRRIQLADQRATLRQRVTTDRPYVERLVAFWSNHLCVSAGKRVVSLLAGPYENEVIRPHVLGRFEDMVLASARHPAMLLYLDNVGSVGPTSPAARRTQRDGTPRGLNENYARELMELHTLGVDGGYTQDDVRALAHVLTGWTVSGIGRGRGDEVDFAFRVALHDRGEHAVLGRNYNRPGEDRGEDVIRDLCRHPSTARFVADKLVRHFVADGPPAEAVRQIERVFLDTRGDLKETALALIAVEAAWSASSRKYRTPQDWLVASLRALKVDTIPPQIPAVLGQLRQPLWAPPSPKGYSDVLGDWGDPDGIMNRAELARSLAARLGEGTTDPSALLSTVEPRQVGPLGTLLGDKSVSSTERIALALAAPAFQWR